MAILIVAGLSFTSVYGFADYTRERNQLQSMLEADVSNLVSTLSLVIADDIFYGKYFELWNRIDAVYKYNHSGENPQLLYIIREIAVTNNNGLIVGHTQPDEHPLLQRDEDSDFEKYAEPANGNKIVWVNDPQPLLFVKFPVFFSNEKIGDITLEVDPQPLLDTQHSLIARFFIFEIVLIAILLFSASILARRLSRPIEQAANVLSMLGTGAVDLPELKSRQDELQRLAVAIESADSRIHANNVAAQNRQAELEGHVQDRTREIESFSYSVSHDLRSPLRAMDGFSQALLEDYADNLDDTGKNYLQRIRAATERMGDLIDDLLMLSSVSRKKLKFEPVNLSVMAHDLADELREEFPGREVDVQIAEKLQARGDARLLRIALRNIIGNAWKYTEKTAQPRIEFGCQTKGEGAVFFVRDNGTGFDMKYVHKLFDAFQRLHGRDEYEGTGIGLAIVHRIIKRHQGEIWAEGDPGQGAIFYFRLGDSENVSHVA